MKKFLFLSSMALMALGLAAQNPVPGVLSTYTDMNTDPGKDNEGIGFFRAEGKTNDYVTYDIDVAKDGTYVLYHTATMKVRNGKGLGLNVIVDGDEENAVVVNEVRDNYYANWCAWIQYPVELQLTAGHHTLKLLRTSDRCGAAAYPEPTIVAKDACIDFGGYPMAFDLLHPAMGSTVNYSTVGLPTNDHYGPGCVNLMFKTPTSTWYPKGTLVSGIDRAITKPNDEGEEVAVYSGTKFPKTDLRYQVNVAEAGMYTICVKAVGYTDEALEANTSLAGANVVFKAVDADGNAIAGSESVVALAEMPTQKAIFVSAQGLEEERRVGYTEEQTLTTAIKLPVGKYYLQLTSTNDEPEYLFLYDMQFVSAPVAGDVAVLAQTEGKGQILADSYAVASGSNLTVNVTPNPGAEITSIVVDGEEVEVTNPAGQAYTFEGLTAPKSIRATFQTMVNSIVVEPTENGSIVATDSSLDLSNIPAGSSVTFDITPAADYMIGSITVDGSPVEVTNPEGQQYTFENLAGDHTIAATFVLVPVYHTINVPGVLPRADAMLSGSKGMFDAMLAADSKATFNINVAEAGDYLLYINAGTKSKNGKYMWFDVLVNDEVVVEYRDSIDYGGNWNVFVMKSVPLTLPAGECTLSIASQSDRWNISNRDLEIVKVGETNTLQEGAYPVEINLHHADSTSTVNFTTAASFKVDNSGFGPADNSSVLVSSQDFSENNGTKVQSNFAKTQLRYPLDVKKSGLYPVTLSGCFSLDRQKDEETGVWGLFDGFDFPVTLRVVDGEGAEKAVATATFNGVTVTDLALALEANGQGGLTIDYNAEAQLELAAGNYMLEVSTEHPYADLLHLRSIQFAEPTALYAINLKYDKSQVAIEAVEGSLDKITAGAKTVVSVKPIDRGITLNWINVDGNNIEGLKANEENLITFEGIVADHNIEVNSTREIAFINAIVEGDGKVWNNNMNKDLTEGCWTDEMGDYRQWIKIEAGNGSYLNNLKVDDTPIMIEQAYQSSNFEFTLSTGEKIGIESEGNDFYGGKPTLNFGNAYRNNHTIYAEFKKYVYAITYTAGENGTIAPAEEGADASAVEHGSNFAFQITPAETYHIASIKVDGNKVAISDPAGMTYTFENVSEAHSIEVEFAINTYVVTVNATANGTVVADKDLAAIVHGEDVTLTITPNEGYEVGSIAIDGEDYANVEKEGKVNVVTLSGVTKNMTVDVEFDAYVGINNVVVDADNQARYFNMQGVEVAKPATGSMYIIVRGNSVSKEIVK